MHSPKCDITLNGEILIIPTGECSQLLPLDPITNELAFLCDSWDSYQLFIVEPQLPEVTVIGDELVTEFLQQCLPAGTIDAGRIQQLNADIARRQGGGQQSARTSGGMFQVTNTPGGTIKKN